MPPAPGIVLVSHSAKLADGLAAMAREVAGQDVVLVAAGGGPDGTLGTDGARVAEAIVRANQGAGVVVLADLGSAVLSVKACLAESDVVDVMLADAPLVEGAIAAAVAASIGADAPAVRQAAEEAWDVRKL
jgi:phosphoenolpyruvate---glycerone phosphotransferase subunit DhaM